MAHEQISIRDARADDPIWNKDKRKRDAGWPRTGWLDDRFD